ncbi:MAG: type IV toxin-antitoxin system AbiEi family antitoxin [Pseudomonas sp.]
MTNFHCLLYFQRMMKTTDSVKIEQKCAEALRIALAQIPAMKQLDILPAELTDPVDLIVQIQVYGKRHTLVVGIKSNGQPRHVRAALLALQDYARRQPEPVIPVFIAPYLSTEAQDICQDCQVAYLDLEGNARLAFGTVFISRQVASKPTIERRELRSLFKPKSAQVLRQLLREPLHPWRVAELAQAAGVSLGLVSNVCSGLVDREWAARSENGVFLVDPDALLDAWGEAYEPPPHHPLGFYTTLHGAEFDQAVRALHPLPNDAPHAVMASFSAAQWLAPYGRTGTHYFYTDQQGLEKLRKSLQLSPSNKGENVTVRVLDDPGLLLDTVQPAPGAFCTSPVQTYLDLLNAGERGREAADFLRREKLTWTTQPRTNPSEPVITTTAPAQP